MAPPVNDDFADAIDITTLGDPGSLRINGTLTDATDDSPPSGGFGENVWYYFDLPAAWDSTTDYWMVTAKGVVGDDSDTCVALYKDVDGTLANLDYLSDGCWDSTVYYDDLVYLATISLNETGFRLYIEVSNFTGAGADFELTFGVGPYVVRVQAEDNLNGDSPTASIVSGWVRDTQASLLTDADPGVTDFSFLPSFYVIEPLLATGVYEPVSARLRRHGANSTNQTVSLLRNELSVGYARIGEMVGLVDVAETLALTGGTGTQQINFTPAEFAMVEGDTLAVKLGFRWTTVTTEYLECDWVEFERWSHRHQFADLLVEEQDSALPYLSGSHLPLGAAGPDISDEVGYHVVAGAGGFAAGMDMCVTDDGSVWVSMVEANGALYTVALRMWDGSSWTTVETDVWSHGDQTDNQWRAFHSRCATDGTDIWVGWGEYRHTGGTNEDWHFKVRRYDVGGASWDSELTVPVPTGEDEATTGFAWEIGSDESSPTMQIGPDGRIWVAVVTYQRSASPINRKPYVWYYDGSWTDTALPDPTIGGDNTRYDAGFVEWESIYNIDLCFRNAAGLSDEPSVAFVARYFGGTTGPFAHLCYSEYDGASWSAYVQTIINSNNETGVWPRYLSRDATALWVNGTDGSLWQQGQRLLDGGDGIYYVAATGYATQNTVDMLAVAKLNQDGDGWEDRSYAGAGWDNIRGTAAGPWQAFGMDACVDAAGRIWVMAQDWDQEQRFIAVAGETGNGLGWRTANSVDPAQALFPSWPSDFSSDKSHWRMVHHAGSIYVLAYAAADTLIEVLGVWQYTIEEFIPQIYRLVFS